MSHGFKLGLRRAKLGDAHPGIGRLQAHLARFGYLGGQAVTGVLDPATAAGLRVYQTALSLPVSGQLDEPTARSVESPRCGLSDRELVAVVDPATPSDASSAARVAGYVLRGCSFKKMVLSHRFMNGTPDLPGDAERQAIRKAFATWTQVLCGVTFPETASASDLATAWHVGDHGDGAPFDGPGNVLAHAFFPPPCGGWFAGQMHFDDAEPWRDDGSTFDLETVALHEIGHLLGLNHSAEPASVMYPTYAGPRRALHADDVAGIRRLYPYVCRIGDSASQAGGVSEIDGATGDGTLFVSAVRALNGTLRLIGWSLSSGPVVARRGTALAGEATSIRIVSDGPHRYVTALRTSTGTLKLIAWTTTLTGEIVRAGDSGSGGTPIVSVDVVRLGSGSLATAARGADGRLIVSRWQIASTGAIALTATAVGSDVVSEVSVTRLSSSRVATAVRLATGELKVSVWQASDTSVALLGSALAGEARFVAAATDAFGRVVTAVRDGAGQLKLILWNVSAAGQVTRTGDSAGQFDEGSEGHDVACAGGLVATSVRTLGGSLKLVLWSTTASGAVTRVGDSAFLGEGVSMARAAVADARRYVSSVRASDGSLRIVQWQRPP